MTQYLPASRRYLQCLLDVTCDFALITDVDLSLTFFAVSPAGRQTLGARWKRVFR